MLPSEGAKCLKHKHLKIFKEESDGKCARRAPPANRWEEFLTGALN